MLKQIINTFSLDNVTHFISLKLNSFEDLLNQYFSHSANIKLLSVNPFLVRLISGENWKDG